MSQITVGQIDNNSQVHILEISYPEKETQFKTIDLIELPDQGLNCLILKNEDLWSVMGDELEKYQHIYPVVNASDLNLSKNLNDYREEEVLTIVENITEKWILHNNLITLEEIFPLKNHLAELFNKDRNTFFEELWFLLKRNLGTSSLSIIFNDVDEAAVIAQNNKQNNIKDENAKEERSERPKLLQSYLKGEKTPEFYAGEEKEQKLMQHFSATAIEPFEVYDFNKEKKQLTCLANIKNSPIIIMAEVLEMNQLQESMLKGLFAGLNL